MSLKDDKNQQNFKFCCYEFENNEQDEVKQTTKKTRINGLMTSPNIFSDIKFSDDMRNTSAKIYKLVEGLFEITQEINCIFPILCQKRVNPQISDLLTERDDLQYYVPQLVTFMTVQCNLENEQLNNLMVKACMTDFYFAHSVYFYLQSLSQNSQGIPIVSVATFISHTLLPKMKIYQMHHLSGHYLMRSMICQKPTHTQQYEKWKEGEQSTRLTTDISLQYGTKDYPEPTPEFPTPVSKVKIKPYGETIGFMETPNFWMDIIDIGEKLVEYVPEMRGEVLSKLLRQQINPSLPATVYIPFFTKMTRLSTILNVWQGRVFSTKERAPFALWIQVYREEEEQLKEVIEDLKEEEERDSPKQKKKKNKTVEIFEKIYSSLSKPFTIAEGKNTLKLTNFLEEQKTKVKQANKNRIKFQSFNINGFSENEKPVALSMIFQNKSQGRSFKSDANQCWQGEKQQKYMRQNLSEKIFGKSSQQMIDNFKKRSIYRNLKSWRMVHLMVKIGDDLLQEQFAMQLIGKFQYIFQKEKVQCILKPYEVISLGRNFGLIQMLNDVVTLDSLYKKIGPMALSLNDFFQKNWRDNIVEAKQNFLKSLVGYSLVTYFLQVKDRHNGNIMLHRDGSIIHIDFGFFLTNVPGKGVELEKKCPFKLLTAYVQVLGGTNSQMFFEFRRLFYKGFKAILQNKEIILSLVRMMHTSYGDMMNCFDKGEKAIEELIDRLNPEGNKQNFCYELINNSLDNWRAEWYDKIQYFLQKTYY